MLVLSSELIVKKLALTQPKICQVNQFIKTSVMLLGLAFPKCLSKG
jgi:hypothetical protein